MNSDAKILLKAVIENKRRQLVTEIRAHTAGLNIGESEADPTDQVQSMIGRDQSAGLVARLSNTLAQVDRSIESLSEGSYGLCVECDGDIGLARLRAIPWASHCIRCQQLLESSELVEVRGRSSHHFGEYAA